MDPAACLELFPWSLQVPIPYSHSPSGILRCLRAINRMVLKLVAAVVQQIFSVRYAECEYFIIRSEGHKLKHTVSGVEYDYRLRSLYAFYSLFLTQI